MFDGKHLEESRLVEDSITPEIELVEKGEVWAGDNCKDLLGMPIEAGTHPLLRLS